MATSKYAKDKYNRKKTKPLKVNAWEDPNYRWAENYPDYDPHMGEDQTAGVDRGLMSDRFYDMLKNEGDPSKMLANSQWANRNYNVQAGQGSASTYGAQNRGVGENELSATHLNNMLASNSPLMRRAAAQAMAGAGGRGLMNSSIAQGAAMGAMIDRATPFAQQDAATYGKTASENMAAENLARKTGAELKTRASLENAALRTQAGIAGMEAGARRDMAAMDIEGRGWDTIRKAMIDIESREDEQAWKTSEAEAGRNWQTGERLGTEEYQAWQNDLNRDWTSRENVLNREADKYLGHLSSFTDAQIASGQAYAQIVSAIFTNPKYNAEQAKAVYGSFRNIWNNDPDLGYGFDLDAFEEQLPPELRQHIEETGDLPDPTGTTTGEGTSETPPVDDGGAYDYSAIPSRYANDQWFREYWQRLGPNEQITGWINYMSGQSIFSPTSIASSEVDAHTGLV